MWPTEVRFDGVHALTNKPFPWVQAQLRVITEDMSADHEHFSAPQYKVCITRTVFLSYESSNAFLFTLLWCSARMMDVINASPAMVFLVDTCEHTREKSRTPVQYVGKASASGGTCQSMCCLTSTLTYDGTGKPVSSRTNVQFSDVGVVLQPS